MILINEIKRLREIAKKNGEPVLREKSFEILLETVKKHSPDSILEIGTNCGLSGCAMLLTVRKAALTGIEIDEDKIVEAKKNYRKFNVSDRAKIFCGDAAEIIPMLTGGYDFIFLDGPKGHYYRYLEYLLPLLNVGGVLFADNVLFRGYVDGKVKTPHRYMTTKHSMENFLAALSENPRLKTEILEVEDGISITEKLY